jgi:hypothetical protein
LRFAAAVRHHTRQGALCMKATLASLLVCFVVAAPASAKLEIVNVEAAHGYLGPERKVLEIYPQDELLVRYRVTGVQVDAAGKTDVESETKLINPRGKTVFETKPTIREELSLGGNTFPSFTVLDVPPPDKAPPGEYTLIVQVRDRISKETASFERKLTVKPVSFQIVIPRFFRDADAKVPTNVGGLVGESLHFKLRVIGFDKSKKKAHVTLKVQVLDSDGKDVTEKPYVIDAKVDNSEEVARISFLKFHHPTYLNRPGNFILRLTAEDMFGNQKSVFETPLKVIAP